MCMIPVSQYPVNPVNPVLWVVLYKCHPLSEYVLYSVFFYNRSKGPIEYDHGNVICKNHRSPPEDEFVHVESDGDNHPPQPRKPRPAQPGTEATNGTVVNYYHSK